MNSLDFAKESLLYISMLFVMAGGTALSAKEYVAGGVLAGIGALLVIVRSVLKKKGYEVKNEEDK